MAQAQAELHLPPRPDEAEESEQDRELRLHGLLLRRIEEAADEVGRKSCCYALALTEQLLSKQLREVDGNRCSYRLLAYLVKNQPSGRLARWLMTDYAGFMAPQRPEKLKPEEALSEVLALALSGEMGNAAKEKVIEIYSRTARQKREEP